LQKQQNKIEIGQKNYIWKLGESSEPPRPPPPSYGPESLANYTRNTVSPSVLVTQKEAKMR